MRQLPKKIFGTLNALEEAALVAAFAALVSLAFAQVVLRNGFETSIIWADVAIRILVLWVTILGAMVATRQGKHIKIDLVSQFLPKKYCRIVEGVGLVLSGIIMGVAAYYCLEMVLLEYEFGTIAFKNVPTWVCQSILPVGFALICLRFVGQGLCHLRKVAS